MGNSLRDTIKDGIIDVLVKSGISMEAKYADVPEIVYEICDVVCNTVNIDTAIQDMEFSYYDKLMNNISGLSELTYLLSNLHERQLKIEDEARRMRTPTGEAYIILNPQNLFWSNHRKEWCSDFTYATRILDIDIARQMSLDTEGRLMMICTPAEKQ
jgi:hypothetical protein